MAHVAKTVAAPAAHAGEVPVPFQRGDHVQVWSEGQNSWLEGRVDEVITQECPIDGVGRVSAGTVRVSTGRRNLYVPPGQVAANLRAACEELAKIAVIGPGAGTKANKAVYADLKRDRRFRIQVLGCRGEDYDRYPEHWEGGQPAPNLASFADELLANGAVAQADCIVAGSRGGQVVLPALWRTLGTNSPPAVCINGGCAMTMPGPPVVWPVNAVTILVLGGKDYFRGGVPANEYIANARKKVPAGNRTTAILYVREMEHMPQTPLLQELLSPAMLAAIYWRASGQPPAFELQSIANHLEASGWNGQVCYTEKSGTWAQVVYGKDDASPRVSRPSTAKAVVTEAEKAAQIEEEKVRSLEIGIAFKEQELQQLKAQLAECKKRASLIRETAKAERAAGGGTNHLAAAAAVAIAATGAYRKGQRVSYCSVTQNCWIECDVIAVRPSDGAVQISVKPDFWIPPEEVAKRIRPLAAYVAK